MQVHQNQNNLYSHNHFAHSIFDAYDDTAELVDFIYKAIDRARKVSRTNKVTNAVRSSALVSLLGIDVNKIRTVFHVTGSSGKGSTAILLGGLLRAKGYNVAVYTKPHVYSPIERLIINEFFISPASYLKHLKIVYDLALRRQFVDQFGLIKYSQLMFLGAMNFLFNEQPLPIDVLIVEAGVGIKNDYTNVFVNKHKNYFKIITNIKRYHTQKLGGECQSIFDDKNYGFKATRVTFLLEKPIGYVVPKDPRFAILSSNDQNLKESVYGSGLEYKREYIGTNLSGKYVETFAKLLKVIDYLKSKRYILSARGAVSSRDNFMAYMWNSKPRFFYINLASKSAVWIGKQNNVTQLFLLSNAHELDQVKNYLIKYTSWLSPLKWDWNIYLTRSKKTKNAALKWTRTLSNLLSKYKVSLCHGAVNFKQLDIKRRFWRKPDGVNDVDKILKLYFKVIKYNCSRSQTTKGRFKNPRITCIIGSVYTLEPFIKLFGILLHPYRGKAVTQYILSWRSLIRLQYKQQILGKTGRFNLNSEFISKGGEQEYIHRLILANKGPEARDLRFYFDILVRYRPDVMVFYKPFHWEKNIEPIISVYIKRYLPKVLIFPVKSDKEWLFAVMTRDKHQPASKNAYIYEVSSYIKEFREYIQKADKTAVFVPALVWDFWGKRLGYGSGVYDRFLEGVSHVVVYPKDGIINANKDKCSVVLNKVRNIVEHQGQYFRVLNMGFSYCRQKISINDLMREKVLVFPVANWKFTEWVI